LVNLFFFSSTRAQTTNNLSVTATVPAQPTDFQATLSCSTTGSPFAQNTEITYQVKYGSFLSYSVGEITVQAEWTLGTVEGSSTATVDLLDYVVGSSSNGYNSTPAVVDTVNKKISWTISNFPANTTDQTVSFKLKTNSSYTGSSQVNFSVKGRVLGPGTQTVDSTVTRGYKYVSSAVSPTSTPTPGPTATPEPGPTSTPTPTPSPSLLQITDVEIRTISSNSVIIFVGTSKKTTLTLRYGDSSSGLTQTVKELSISTDHLLNLRELDANKNYYFRITAADEKGSTIASDLFTFKTGRKSSVPTVNSDSVVVISSNVIVLNSQQEKKKVAVVPNESTYSFKFKLEDTSTAVKDIRVIIRNKQTLGIRENQTTEANSGSNEAIEVSPGNYSVLLVAPKNPGYYETFARISDSNGNIAENKLFDLKVSNKFTVLEKNSNKPIEKAQISLSFYNLLDKKYHHLTSDLFTIKNPEYSDLLGSANFLLPQGKYRADVIALGYERKTVDFSIGPNPGEDYPTVYLGKKPFNIGGRLIYYGNLIVDWVSLTKDYIRGLAYSSRFFELGVLVSIGFFVCITYFAFSTRLKIPFHSLIAYFSHHFKLAKIEDKKTLNGKIVGEKTIPLENAEVLLIDSASLKVVNRVQTDLKGQFSFPILDAEYSLLITKNGHKPVSYSPGEIKKLQKTGLVLSLRKHDLPITFREDLKISFEKLIGLLFESLLVFSVILEFAFGYTLGWAKAAPFIIVSCINVFFWILHIIKLESEINVH